MYSVAALSVSTLLGFRSGRISGTMRFKRENMVFKFLICAEKELKLHINYQCARLDHPKIFSEVKQPLFTQSKKMMNKNSYHCSAKTWHIMYKE